MTWWNECVFCASSSHLHIISFRVIVCLGYLKFHKQQSPECPTLDSTTAHQNKKSKTERNRWVSSGTSDNRTYASNQWNGHFNINSSGTASILVVFQHLSMVHWIQCLFFGLFQLLKTYKNLSAVWLMLSKSAKQTGWSFFCHKSPMLLTKRPTQKIRVIQEPVLQSLFYKWANYQWCWATLQLCLLQKAYSEYPLSTAGLSLQGWQHPYYSYWNKQEKPYIIGVI